jgi:hypothetical protein
LQYVKALTSTPVQLPENALKKAHDKVTRTNLRPLLSVKVVPALQPLRTINWQF